jgi:hypothetical protein
MKIVYKIGNFNARLLLTIFYYTLVLPYGLVFMLGRTKKKTGTNWVMYTEKDDYAASLKEQF